MMAQSAGTPLLENGDLDGLIIMYNFLLVLAVQDCAMNMISALRSPITSISQGAGPINGNSEFP